MDFAENWCCQYQDEVSVCYYNNKQINIHPRVVHHKDDDNNIVHHSYVGVTDDTAYTAPTIMAFVINAVMPHVKAALPGLKVAHFVTDSPSSQYRNRTMCAIVANFNQMFSVKATWTWLEAGHGNGPCDGVGGSVKKAANNMVKSGRSLQCTQELCEALQQAAIKPHILEVTQDKIAEVKAELSARKMPMVRGIMSTHAICCTGDQLVKRDLPCFAECCYGYGGVFHHACEGWSSAFCGALISNEDATADDHNPSNTPSTSVACTLTPEDLEDRPPTTVGVGSYSAIAYGKRWYVAKVTDMHDGVFRVSYMTPCRGKWKWGMTDK